VERLLHGGSDLVAHTVDHFLDGVHDGVDRVGHFGLDGSGGGGGGGGCLLVMWKDGKR